MSDDAALVHRPLRCALITQGGTIAAWQADAVRRVPTDVAQVVLTVDVTPPADPPPPGSRWHSTLADRYRRHRLFARGRALEPVPVATVAPDAETVGGLCTRTHDGRLALSPQLVGLLRDSACDIALNLSGWPLAGPPSGDVPFGVWEHRVAVCAGGGGSHRARGLTPRLLRVALVCVGADAPADAVLQEGWVHSVPHSVAATIEAPYVTTVEWLARTCRQVQRHGQLPAHPASAPPATQLSDRAIVAAALRSPVRKLQRVVQAPFWQEFWQVGIVDTPIEQVFRTGHLHAQWLDQVSSRVYLADPFGVPGSTTVLAEAYDLRTRRGHIAAVDGYDTGTPVVRPVLDTGGHMSYPYLFEHDGELYCVPETCDARRVTLYRAVDVPDKWEPISVLVDGLAATDASVFEHEGRWWLLCTDDDLGAQSNLYAFHAPALDGPWTPHLLNPVKIDIRSARPAGPPFVVDGRLIRPAQDATSGYGSAVVFNEVLALTPETFCETPAGRLDPDPDGPYPDGLHTVSAWGQRTLVDGKRTGLSMTNLLGRVARLRPRARTEHAERGA